MRNRWMVGVLWIGLMILGIPSAQAQVPHLIRYQATVTDKAGVPLEGPYTLTFRIYDAQTLGNKLWEEMQANVPIAKGSFSVFLGGVTPLGLAFDKDLWLSIQVANDPEMTPRIRLTAVPTAYRAERAEVAEGLANPVKTSTITDDTNRLVPSGAIILWTGASCPAGYTRAAALDGKFLASGATYNPAAGGSNTKDISHTHSTPAHSHNIPRGDYPRQAQTTWNKLAVAASGHDQELASDISTSTGGSGTTGTGGSTSLDIRPEFAMVLLCQKD